jgi:hypothetical protein
VKSTKLSKNIVPRAIASMATVRIALEVPGLKNVTGTSSSKAGGGGPSSKIVVGVKGPISSVKRCIIPTIGAPADISLEGTQESTPHGQTL